MTGSFYNGHVSNAFLRQSADVADFLYFLFIAFSILDSRDKEVTYRISLSYSQSHLPDKALCALK